MNRTTIGSVGDFEINRPHRVEPEGSAALCVVRLDNNIKVFVDCCPHAECELSDGNVEDGDIECPCHGALFSLSDGTAVAGPTQIPISLLPVEITDAEVIVVLMG